MLFGQIVKFLKWSPPRFSCYFFHVSPAFIYRHAEPQLSASRLHWRLNSRPSWNVASTPRIWTHSATDSVENRCRPTILLRVTLNECQRSATISSAADTLQPAPDTDPFTASFAFSITVERKRRRHRSTQQPNNHIVPSRTNILFLDMSLSHPIDQPSHHARNIPNPPHQKRPKFDTSE